MTVDVPISEPAVDNDILNYSIISDEGDKTSLVVKLKISEKNKPSLLKKFRNEYTLSPRTSARARIKKSFPDYDMPLGFGTPSRKGQGQELFKESSLPKRSTRGRTRNVMGEKTVLTPTKITLDEFDEVMDSDCSPSRKGSPVKRGICFEEEKIGSTQNVVDIKARQRKVSISQRNEIVSTPTKRNKQGEEQNCTPGKKLRSRTSSWSMEEADIIMKTPEKRMTHSKQMRNELNLNSSFISPKRCEEVLRCNLTRLNLDDSFKSPKKSEKILSINLPRQNLDESFRKTLLKSSLDGIESSRPRRSRRSSQVPYFYYEIDNVEDEERPVRRRGATSVSDDNESVFKTPTKKKNNPAPKSSAKRTPKTPKNRAKLIRDGVITPSMHSRTNIVRGDSTPLMKARSQLHVSYIPTALPCREKEYCDIFNFLEGKLMDGCGGCMYISGVPGTGKTATVTSVVSNLKENDDVPKFIYVSVNGMRLTEPRQSYVEIWKQLTDKTIPWEQAQSLLEERFTKKKNLTPVVMVIDELDILCTKRQDVVYNLLDWPTKAKNQLIVITIANTMDLPERLLMNRVTSRLGLTRLTFQAYTHKQLQEIVTKRLSGTDSFNPDAIQFVARKVASVSGDARRALDICRKAAEIAENEGKSQLVNMTHVNEALNAMITQPRVMAIKHCSRLEKLILQAIVAEVERTGVEETTFADVYKMLVTCCALDGFKMVSSTTAQSAIFRLSACRLILTDQKCCNIFQKIILNVSTDDVYYALKKD